MLPYLNAGELKSEVRATVARLARDRNEVLPGWARARPDAVFAARRFIVCGSTCMPEVRALARHAEVVGIVDDFLCRERSDIEGFPLMGADDWIDRARRDPGISTVILSPSARAFQYFVRLCTQWQLEFLDPLQFLHLLKAHGARTRGEAGRFFWYGHEFFECTLEQADALLGLADRLDDEYSRISWLCVMLYRLTLNPLWLDGCAVGVNNDRFGLNSYGTNRQFFSFSDNEVYVDGGAFTGYTIEHFLRAVRGRFRHVHAFEPSAGNVADIRSRLAGLQEGTYPGLPVLDRVTVVQKGLWSREGRLLFVPGMAVDRASGAAIQPLTAHLVDAGMMGHLYDKEAQAEMAVEVPVTTIDQATGGTASFIKLEIEGAELQALHGAAKTIERNRPRMALSVYHKPEDLTAITRFVLDTGLDYRLGFRQHNPFCPDAMVLYCQPAVR